MQRRLHRWLRWWVGGAFAIQATGCAVDPDIAFQAAILFASDLSIFLLENAAASF